jgi:hypothetical protein
MELSELGHYEKYLTCMEPVQKIIRDSLVEQAKVAEGEYRKISSL